VRATHQGLRDIPGSRKSAEATSCCRESPVLTWLDITIALGTMPNVLDQSVSLEAWAARA
jgi:hypothetical protein